MNIMKNLFLSFLLFGGSMYGMDHMSKKEFSDKYNQFKNFSLNPNNRHEFEALHKDLINHIDNNNSQIYKSFKGLINGTYTQKMQMLPQEFIHYNGLSVPHTQLNNARKNLFESRRPEIAIVAPNQYVYDKELGIIIFTKNVNNKNEN